jgi:hypothetical protein
MESPWEEVSLEHDRRYLISFALEIEMLFSQNNLLCQASILLVFSASDLITPTVSSTRIAHTARIDRFGKLATG